ncbi:MAG TPA: response regulator transcription factor [Burkholderiales bacterium]|nr:response regulator transcription factor [Burkholderiales bacterium]
MKSESTSEPPAVLIVEDHAAMRAGLSVLLQTAFPGCRILEADSGARALAVCFEHQPRLILMDVCLPDANGIEFTGRLLKLFRDVSIIIVSNLNAQVYFEQARAVGALGYIVKDRLSEELIPAVAKALGIAPAGRK